MTTSKMTEGLILATGLIAISLGLAWAGKAGMVDADLPTRVTMAISGLFIAYYGNSIPKVLLRSEKAIWARRVIGWAFVLSGVGTAALWFILPVKLATGTTLLLVGGTLLLAVLICALSRNMRRSAQQ
ncbi:MAG: hypothetical protein ABL973_13340 [Micropepsaceae bacterium]